jgi:putative membrane protein insertion efficiency factor
MSTLRQCLRNPGTYLALLALVVAAASADSLRPPDEQLSVRVYSALVHSYQDFGSPMLAGFVRCRFYPTCSHSSVEAVRKYGLRKGLLLTSTRLWRCRRNVPLGTDDPVP